MTQYGSNVNWVQHYHMPHALMPQIEKNKFILPIQRMQDLQQSQV